MTWAYWISLYTSRHCTARGLRASSIAAYQSTLEQFRAWVRFRLEDREPDRIAARDVLAYVEHLRTERGNGAAAVNRQVAILKSFYRAMVAMGYLPVSSNPMAHFPRMRPAARKLPRTLTEDETDRLLESPVPDTVLGLRDRALLVLLYATGARASECASLRDADVDLTTGTVTFTGKGGHQRALPIEAGTSRALAAYRRARGQVGPEASFFRSRRGRALSRNAIYERVRTHGQRSRLPRSISPHTLRHTFATHLVRAGENVVTIQNLLGHRWISSTQIYMHVTAHDLREAAERHPIARMLRHLEDLLPTARLPQQHARPPLHRRYG